MAVDSTSCGTPHTNVKSVLPKQLKFNECINKVDILNKYDDLNREVPKKYTLLLMNKLLNK